MESFRTFEGRLIIKWYKNDSGDIRPLTIDVNSERELEKELYRIREDFMTKGCDIRPEKKGQLPYSVTFEMKERI
jgi:hypothetical protein